MQEVYYPVDRDSLRRELRDLMTIVTYTDYPSKVENLFSERAKPADHVSTCKAVIQALHHTARRRRLSTAEIQAIVDGASPTAEQRLRLEQSASLERAIAHVLLITWPKSPALIDYDVYDHIGALAMLHPHRISK